MPDQLVAGFSRCHKYSQGTELLALRDRTEAIAPATV